MLASHAFPKELTKTHENIFKYEKQPVNFYTSTLQMIVFTEIKHSCSL